MKDYIHDNTNIIDNKKLKRFYKDGDFVCYSEKINKPMCYLWEYDIFNRKFTKNMFKLFYIYSLIEKKNNAYIVEGYIKNEAIGYFVSRRKIEFSDTMLKYW